MGHAPHSILHAHPLRACGGDNQTNQGTTTSSQTLKGGVNTRTGLQRPNKDRVQACKWTMVTGQPAVGEKNAQAPSRAAQQAGRGAPARRRPAKWSASPGSKVGRVAPRAPRASPPAARYARASRSRAHPEGGGKRTCLAASRFSKMSTHYRVGGSHPSRPSRLRPKLRYSKLTLR